MKMPSLSLFAVLALSSMALAASQTNQDEDTDQDKRFKAWVAPFLEQLDLTEEQEPTFLAIQKSMRTKWSDFQKLPAEERQPKQQAFYRAKFKELELLLTPQQMAKYRELRNPNATGRATRDQPTSDRAKSNKAEGQPNIRLAEIDGRHWLVGSDGKPFFAHGITHLSNRQAKIDLAQVSIACKRLGFNAYGYGCPAPLRQDMPYIESWNHLVPISYYRGKNGVKFVDIFDPKEQARLDAGVKENCRRRSDQPQNVIGYCWTDLGSWPLENPADKNWVSFIQGLPAEAPGQKAYQAFLESWEGDEKARDQAFLKLIAREYFRVVGEAQRRYAPDHIIFGDRFAFETFDPDVVQEMLPYVDAIAIQPPFWGPFPKKRLDEIHQITGKPILLCDFAIRFKDGDKDVRMWKISENSVVAGKAYTEYVKAALDTDYVIGVFWCNPVDTPKGFGKSGVKQGFFADGLASRPGLHDAVKELNDFREKVTPTELNN